MATNPVKQERDRLYYLNNKDKKKAAAKARRDANPELFNLRAREWYQANKSDELRAKKRAYDATRYENPVARIAQNMRVRIRQALKGQKSKTTESLVGCTFESLKAHIESQFKPGMTWDNYGEWHVDHVIPFATTNDINKLEQLCHYTNLQPLWALENLKKSKKVA